MILGQYHRFFSVLFVRGQAACLTTRLGHLGDDDRDNAGRRRELLVQEERASREAEAFFMVHSMGWRRGL